MANTHDAKNFIASHLLSAIKKLSVDYTPESSVFTYMFNNQLFSCQLVLNSSKFIITNLTELERENELAQAAMETNETLES